MAMVNVHDNLHERIKALVKDASATAITGIGKFVHDSLEKSVTKAEKALARQKEKLNK